METAHERRKSHHSYVAVAIVIAGAALRLYNLATWDMWTDEVQTLWTSASLDFSTFGPMYALAPLNFFLTKLGIELVGANELGLRLAPFLAGSLTVLFFYFFFRRWIGSRAALFGAAIVAFSMWHVSWSQTGRHFAFQTLLILCAAHTFLIYWRHQKRPALWISAGVILLGLFTHSSTGFFVAAMLGFIVIEWIRSVQSERHESPGTTDAPGYIRSAFLVILLPVLLYLPAYVVVGSYILEHRTAWNPPWNIIGSLAFYLPFYLVLPALGGSIVLWEEDDSLYSFLLCLLVIPMVLVCAASAVTIASAAYTLACIIPVAALIGVLIDRLIDRVQPHGVRIGVLLLASVVFAGQAYDLAHYYVIYNGLKPRWKEATAFVAEHWNEGDILWAAEGDVGQYYLTKDQQVEWLDEYLKLKRSNAYPPDDVEGAWFAVYVPGRFRLIEQLSLQELLTEAELEAVFPLHYGAKTRTIAVLYDDFGT